jgi:hypothetical protein
VKDKWKRLIQSTLLVIVSGAFIFNAGHPKADGPDIPGVVAALGSAHLSKIQVRTPLIVDRYHGVSCQIF